LKNCIPIIKSIKNHKVGIIEYYEFYTKIN